MPNPELPAYERIDVRTEGRVGVVTLNRPELLNAWDWLMWAELSDAYGRMDQDDDVRVIVLTGAGDAFCAGAALEPDASNWDGASERDRVADRYPGPRHTASSLRTPVIAAINGAAVGAGITMAMQADIRVAADDAKIAFLFHRRGVVPDGDLLWSLPRQIGYAPAMDLLLTGRSITGAEAARLGLVSRTAPRSEVLDLAMEIAQDMAAHVAPVPVAISKALARRLLQVADADEAMALQSEAFLWSVRQPDAVEGVVAFMERREPRWSMSKVTDVPAALTGEIDRRRASSQRGEARGS